MTAGKDAKRPDYGALRAWLATTQQANAATLEEAVGVVSVRCP